jgi:hypothetical protein
VSSRQSAEDDFQGVPGAPKGYAPFGIQTIGSRVFVTYAIVGGALRDVHGKKRTIDGLWALEFGNSGSNGDPGTLFFTAGPNDESDGLFGTITTS